MPNNYFCLQAQNRRFMILESPESLNLYYYIEPKMSKGYKIYSKIWEVKELERPNFFEFLAQL